ncbi:hypothetical protein Tco_0611579, partial [Tanacetum coccineum]
MNLTTLPKSFWGYALESVVRILNMVPTKKVDKTPYEIWHGKAPKLIPKGNDPHGTRSEWESWTSRIEPAIAIANDPRILKGARHLQRKYHYIR